MKKYTLRNYIEYLKDNPEHYWFKRRLFGWGWVPATMEGFTIVFAFIVFVMVLGINFGLNSEIKEPTTRDFLATFGGIIASIIILIWICFKKGEKPQWAWGVIRK